MITVRIDVEAEEHGNRDLKNLRAHDKTIERAKSKRNAIKFCAQELTWAQNPHLSYFIIALLVSHFVFFLIYLQCTVSLCSRLLLILIDYLIDYNQM